jgi:GrpB-like predicted nucleotidyltransferase (UPF0157 family)
MSKGKTPMTDQKPKPIIVVDYDPAWPDLFLHLQRVISGYLGELILAIEHVGSTSVPGLAAKPILDIDIVIESVETLPQVVERLAELGYLHKGDGGIPGREAFDREGVDVPRNGEITTWLPHHLYVCTQDNIELARHLAFRDYLREHSDAVVAYQKLKKELAIRYRNDRVAYTEAKTDFVWDILKRVMTM